MRAYLTNGRALGLAFRMGARQALTQPIAVLGQLTILSALLLSYGSVLGVVSASDLARFGFTSQQMIWYITVTEIVAMVSIWYYRQLQRDVRSGQIDIWLLRPIEFWPLFLAEWAGQELLRIVPVAAAGFLFGRFLTGTWGLDGVSFLLLVPAIVLSTMIILCWCFLLGISAVWIGESSPLFWLYQKLLFVLGGLLWPLAIYPHWLRMIAWATPFPAILATPGDYALHQGIATMAAHAALQLVWISILLGVCVMTAGAARRRLAR